MSSVNEGSCFWCGEEVDPEAWDEIGHCKVWVCNKRECHRELRREQGEAYEQARQEALERLDEEWNR